MSERKIEKLTNSLLNFYLAKIKKGENIFLLDTKPGENFFNQLNSEKRFKGIFSFELIESFIDEYMQGFKKKKINNEDVKGFLNELESYLNKNLQDYWIITPLSESLLPYAEIIDEDLFIINLTKESSKKFLENILGRDYFDYISKKYQNLNTNFDDVLLGYKLKCQTNYVETYYNILAYSLNSFIHLYFYSEIYPQNNYDEKKFDYHLNKLHILPFDKPKSVNYIVLSSEINSIIKTARYDTSCRLDLSFLYEKNHINNFKEILYLLLKEFPTQNILTKKLLDSILLFKSSIELNNKNDFLGISLPIILLTTASESLLLNPNDSKRSNLKSILSAIYKKNDFSSEEIKNIVDEIYSLRSEFVHGGTRIYKDFNKDFSIGKKSELLLNFQKILAGSIYNLLNYLLALDESKREIRFFEKYLQVYKVRNKKESSKWSLIIQKFFQ